LKHLEQFYQRGPAVVEENNVVEEQVCRRKRE
jgi:hypothetical protein